MNKTSMSVRKMGRLLGLGKTDSYWLLKRIILKSGSSPGKCV